MTSVPAIISKNVGNTLTNYKTWGGILYNVKAYGAIGDGVTDDTVAIQAAINAIPQYGGIVYFPPGVYAISGTINIGDGNKDSGSTKHNNLRLIGAGCGGESFLPNISTKLKWIGASGGTMVSINGQIFGASIGGISLDGNSLASKGLIVNNVCESIFGDITVINCTGDAMTVTTQTTTAAEGTTGCIFPRIKINVPSGGRGLVIDGDINASSDVNQCHFDIVQVRYDGNNTIGMVLGFADFNTFNIISMATINPPSGTTYGLLFVGRQGTFPSNNHFKLLNLDKGGLHADTTSGTPNQNFVEYYDTADGAGVMPNIVGLSGRSQNPSGSFEIMNFGVGSSPALVATIGRTLITSTASQNVLALNTPETGLYEANIYLEVVTATTTVSVVVFSGDDEGSQFFYANAIKSGGVTQIVLSSASLLTGSYICLPVIVRYTKGQAQKPLIQVTTGTANQVYVTANLTRLS